jgi:hypothetical protein
MQRELAFFFGEEAPRFAGCVAGLFAGRTHRRSRARDRATRRVEEVARVVLKTRATREEHNEVPCRAHKLWTDNSSCCFSTSPTLDGQIAF